MLGFTHEIWCALLKKFNRCRIEQFENFAVSDNLAAKDQARSDWITAKGCISANQKMGLSTLVFQNRG
jgi:hypothetical protein